MKIQIELLTDNNGIMTAVCDAIGLVVEADNFATLLREIELVAPDLVELNSPNQETIEYTLHHESTHVVPQAI